jgi:hypothetical protein
MARYLIELRVLNSYFELMTKVPLTVEADDQSDDEGTWFVPPWASKFFGGVSSGDWMLQDYESEELLKEIVLWAGEVPNMFAIWRDHPGVAGQISDIFKLPLFQGETGSGSVGNGPFHSITWRVAQRNF